MTDTDRAERTAQALVDNASLDQKIAADWPHVIFDYDTRRELQKILDVLETAESHFDAEARMNAALHMAREVRPAPLAVAIYTARQDLARLLA